VDLFIARQPIFDRDQRIYAYELLFRSGPDGAFHHPDPDQASARVIADSLLAMGLTAVAEGKRVFINLTRDLLLKDLIMLLPRDQVVVEVLETVEPDPLVVQACRRLKAAGYLIALDDFTRHPRMAPLVALADIIKVDVLATGLGERRALAKEYRPRGIRLLAEKVETPEGFREARELGYAYFQGYFFARPAVMQARGVPESRLTYLQLLQEALKPDPDFQALDRSIRGDVTLSYKLLRYINSPFFGLRRQVTSIRDALSLLGNREVRRWASLIALASMGADKPAALVQEAAIRGRFCELLAAPVGLGDTAESLFLAGLFSLMDALLDRPLPAILQELSLPGTATGILLGESGPGRSLFESALAYLRGDWANFARCAAGAGLAEDAVPPLHREALAWAREALDPTAAPSS
jgi:EAL and modified HD-GYP domain-containing signal transduction protein